MAAEMNKSQTSHVPQAVSAASSFTPAKTVQEAVKSSLESVTGLCVGRVNVNICGIALPREAKK